MAIAVEDDGIGIDPTGAPKGTGLGSRIVRSMASTLGDGLHYLEGQSGTVAEVPLKHFLVEALIPSVTHPGLVSQPGTHTLSLGVQQLPFDLAHGDWDTRKEEWADKVLEIYFRYAPNMRNHILARHVITPLDLHRDYHITRGNIFHQSMIGLDNLFDNCPIKAAAHYRTPIPGYYLCGSGSHPGGGVSGMPGHNAAQRILADLAGQTDTAAGRKVLKADNGLIGNLLKTDVGQRLGYQVARSRIFRSLTERLSK